MRTIRKEIVDYIEKIILIQYTNLDSAHGIEHIHYVINKALRLGEIYNLNQELLYVCAAFHDLGMLKDRATHEKISAQMLLNDSTLSNWFSNEQILLMCEAVEDHRASSVKEPRNIYGKVLAHADRNLDLNIIIPRALAYGFSKYPTLTLLEQTERVYNYIVNKYGDMGYLTLWLDYEEDKIALEKIQNVITDKDYFMDLCNKQFKRLNQI